MIKKYLSREASIAEIHQLPFDARIAAIAEIENFSVSNARIAGNATIAGKLNKTVSISTQRSLVTKLCDPCVTRDACDHMETKLLENQALKAYIFTSIYDLSTGPRGKSLIFLYISLEIKKKSHTKITEKPHAKSTEVTNY